MQSRPSSLCQLAGVWSGAVPDGGMVMQEKVDGWRALWLPDHTGQRMLFTRNGCPIGGVGHIAWQLERMEAAAGQPMVFDGEFQVGGTLDATKRWCESGWKAGGEAGQLFVFDAVPLADWQRGECPMPYHERRRMLEEAFQAVEGEEWTWPPDRTAGTLCGPLWRCWRRHGLSIRPTCWTRRGASGRAKARASCSRKRWHPTGGIGAMRG